MELSDDAIVAVVTAAQIKAQAYDFLFAFVLIGSS